RLAIFLACHLSCPLRVARLAAAATRAAVVLLDDFDTHRARGARDRTHRRLEISGGQILQLGLRDLLDLLAGYLAYLVLVGSCRTLLDAGRFEQQDRGRRALGHEGKRTVGVHRDDHRDDQSRHGLGLRIEGLAKLHDIDAALAERRADRRRRVGRPRRNLQLYLTDDFLRHLTVASRSAASHAAPAASSHPRTAADAPRRPAMGDGAAPAALSLKISPPARSRARPAWRGRRSRSALAPSLFPGALPRRSR